MKSFEDISMNQLVGELRNNSQLALLNLEIEICGMNEGG